jgi:branched-subunit amino acid transport protein
MNQTDLWTVVTIVGMALLTVITRCFFFLSSNQWAMPGWLQRGLHYAPIAAMAAVIVPEMVTTQGHLISTWQDARIFAVAAGLACFYWKRSMFGTIIVGMAVYLPLHVGLGW